MFQTIKILIVAAGSAFLFSCSSTSQKGEFTVLGELKNVPDQKVYLEELYFSQKDPLILDTAEIIKGKFSVATIASDQGLYRLRLEKTDAPFIFINDQPTIPLSADQNTLSLETVVFNSPANHLLRNFLTTLNAQNKRIEEKTLLLQQYKNPSESDSLFQVMKKDLAATQNEYQNYILHYLDTTSNAVMALFSLGYTRNIEPKKLEPIVGNLVKRFPGNEAIAMTVTQYNQMLTQYNSKPHVGGPAPDITMTDTSGKPFSLSALRGKYVLVDFWASWCGPCRRENPNVVNAYNKFSNKNFTVLGVSLDKDKASWVKAIADDHLNWYHISDLKFWNSAAVGLYGFDGIPYNVLVDPNGNIIAESLRENELLAKLEEVLK